MRGHAALPLLLSALVARAVWADVSAHVALEPRQIHVGERATVSVEVEGAQNVEAPTITAGDGLDLRYVGPSTEVSIVNGEVTASVTHRYTVVATRAGTYRLGPVIVEHEGRRYDAGRVTLRVVPASSPPATTGVTRTELRLVLRAGESEAYLHERVPLTIELRVGPVRVTDLQYPTVAGDGFAVDALGEPAQREEQTAGGTVQVVAFETALTPLRTGALTIGPARMQLARLVRERQDRFFGFFGETRRPLELHSEPLALTVLPLPEPGRPRDFSGAVGRFELHVEAAPRELTAGDPVTITTIVRGVGNLEHLTAPAFVGGDGLRVYPPQARDAPAGAGDVRVFEQVAIPERAGAVSLPPLRLTFFDPATGRYETREQAPIALTVHASAHATREPTIVGAVPARPRPEALGRDIVFIKDSPGTLRPVGSGRARSVGFWAWQPVPLLLWIAVVVWDRRRRRLAGDERLARFSRAGREARAGIAEARAALDAADHSRFYDTLARAVTEYLAAKLGLPVGGITVDAVATRLDGFRGVADVTRELGEFLALSERARFAPAAVPAADAERALTAADTIVRRLERERRLARPLVAACLVLATAVLAPAQQHESPNTLFFRGNTHYTEERFAEAIAAYEQVRAAGYESANLHFNLGNAHMKAGDVARAVLAYERARRLAPSDPDVLANLAYARSESSPGPEPPLWARLAFPLAERRSTDGLLLASSIAYTVLALLLVAGRLAPTSERVARIAAGAAGVVLVVLASSAGRRILTVDWPVRAVVVAPEAVTVRFEPAATGTVHFEAGPGAMVRVLAERAGWAQIARRDGRRGWVERGAIEAL